MNEFLERIWLGNPVKNYLIVAGVILLVIILKRFISRYLAALLFSVVHRIWKDVDKASFINLVVRPLGFFLLIFVSFAALDRLVFPEELNVVVYRYKLQSVIESLSRIIIIISFIGLLMRIIDFIALILEKRANLTEDQTDNQLIIFFKDFFKVVLGIIGIMLILKFAFKLNIGSLLTGLSIVGAAIALALRESIENLIASFIIFFDKPFTTGDLVKVHHVTGTVEKIGLRSTRIRTDQKTYVTVPNKQMVDSILDNLSLRTQRRADIRLELDPTTKPAKIEALVIHVRDIIARNGIEDYSAVISEISPKAVVITSDYYTSPITMSEFNSIKENINLSILQKMEELGIHIAGALANLHPDRDAI